MTLETPAETYYRLVWTSSTKLAGTRTIASEPMTRAEALQQFDNVREIRRSCSRGQGRLRVLATEEYERIRLEAEHMAALTIYVLNHFADELKNVGAARLAHEAERAETLPRSPVGDAMRLIVDTEIMRWRRDLLALHLHIGRCASPNRCAGTTSSDLLRAELILGQRGWDEVAARMDRWEKAGYDGGLFDAEYDSPSPVRGDR